LTFERKKFRNSILQFLTCSILCNFSEEISLIEHCDLLVNWPVFTDIEWSEL